MAKNTSHKVRLFGRRAGVDTAGTEDASYRLIRICVQLLIDFPHEFTLNYVPIAEERSLNAAEIAQTGFRAFVDETIKAIALEHAQAQAPRIEWKLEYAELEEFFKNYDPYEEEACITVYLDNYKNNFKCWQNSAMSFARQIEERMNAHYTTTVDNNSKKAGSKKEEGDVFGVVATLDQRDKHFLTLRIYDTTKRGDA